MATTTIVQTATTATMKDFPPALTITPSSNTNKNIKKNKNIKTSPTTTTTEKMNQGFKSFKEAADDIKLNWWQQCVLRLAIIAIQLYRMIITPLQYHILQKFRDECNQKCRNNKIVLPDMNTLPDEIKTSNHFTEQDRLKFEKTGILGPFKLLQQDQAKAFGNKITQSYKNGDFDGDNFVLGDEAYKYMKSKSPWTLGRAGMYRGYLDKDIRDIIRSPEIAHRAAGILGKDVICWRTEFFDKNPGSKGTIWHQNSDFKEFNKQPKLIPTKETDSSMIQITSWTALTDVTIEAGALRVLPGSFVDGRLVELYKFFQRYSLLSLSLLTNEQLEYVIKVVIFSTGLFFRARMIFEVAEAVLGDPIPFDEFDVQDLTMKAGESVIFTSLNTHGSYPNVTVDKKRMALVARLTACDVWVNNTYRYNSAGKIRDFPLPEKHCFQVYGNNDAKVNNVMQD